MSGDPAQEYIGDGISENITSALSMGSAIFVIARNSTFTYKGRAVKVQHIAEDLGIRYVLEGSVQKSGDRLRVTAQLIDALTGHHLWSERYDRKMGELFEAAIKLAPGHVLAHVWLGATYTIDAAYGWSESPVDSFKCAHELAQKALTLDDKSAAVHTLLGLIYLFQRRDDNAIVEGKRAISLAPNLSIGYAHLAQTMFFSGRSEKAIELMKKAMRLSPYYPAFYLSCLVRSYAFLVRYDEAIVASNQLYDRGRRGDFQKNGR
jgi:adenylate cyclase